MIICSDTLSFTTQRKSNLSYYKKDAHALRCVGVLFLLIFSHTQKKGTADLTVPFLYVGANSVRPFNVAFSMTIYPF